ncbi:MAG: extracellular solute-binding protein [Gemmatimonadaceae bacterium]|nr:extracellular solute-binding protein [Gemmatimonadaceae bacterium]
MRRLGFGALLVAAACGGGGASADTGPLVVFNAGSLARPLKAALDSFAAREGIVVAQEHAGSLESVRKLTDLGKTPDVLALADASLFPRLLIPAHTSWYTLFAENRLVIAYTDRSKFAGEADSISWPTVLMRRGVETGRSDPDADPNGYRALLALQLTERARAERGLARRLLAAMPERNVRPKEADLVALLQAGELDYIWSYESMARAAGLRFVRLSDRVDLGTLAESTFYATASTRVRGAAGSAPLTIRGEPIVYGLTIPTRAPHRATAERFVRWLASDAGRAVLRAEGLDALATPVVVGTGFTLAEPRAP